MINPGAVHQTTKKPNRSPPERVRLHRINITTGELLISSIHLDFDINKRLYASKGNGLRGAIHGVTSFTRAASIGDLYFVVISGDLLIDNKSGQPYQPSFIHN